MTPDTETEIQVFLTVENLKSAKELIGDLEQIKGVKNASYTGEKK